MNTETLMRQLCLKGLFCGVKTQHSTEGCCSYQSKKITTLNQTDRFHLNSSSAGKLQEQEEIRAAMHF